MNSNNKSTKSGSRPGTGRNQSQRKKQGQRTPSFRSASSKSFQNPTAAASAYSTGVSVTKPRISQRGTTCVIAHREFVGNISGVNATTFTNSFSLALNPGLPSTFPWLANMAQNFETYRIRRMKFSYLTRTATSTVGSIILAPDYDASDGAPISEQVVDQYEDAKEDVPWKNLECILNVSAMHNTGPRKYIRFGSLSSNQDIKMYDVGTMFVFTVDSAAAASWGKLWVEYEIELHTPQLPSGGSNFSYQLAVNGLTTLTAAEPFGVSPTVVGNLQCVVGNNGTNNTIVLSNAQIGGEYICNIVAQGTVITGAVAVQSNTGSNAVTLKSVFNAAATLSISTLTFTPTASTVTLVIFGTATTITLCNVFISLIPTGSGA